MGHVFRDKLKALKVELKKWNHEAYGAFETRIPELTTKIEGMKLKGEAGDLSLEEVKVWKEDC
ncbi:hypothetical protein A2U01_0080274, partial [Trifolium medium]|nr:hypothetical protein [Trifolium medium]